MALIFGNPFDTRGYTLEFSTAPVAVRASNPFKVRFNVRNPRNGERVAAFEEIHDKRFPLLSRPR